MKTYIIILLVIISTESFSQSIDPCVFNTIQTQVEVDTFVVPDAIFLDIETHEKESSDELDLLESKIVTKLKSLGIDTESNLNYTDFGSRVQSKLFGKDIKQSRKYELRLSDADTAAKVISELNDLNIGRIEMSRLKFRKEESLMQILSARAILKAKNQAMALTTPIGQSIGRAIHIMDVEKKNIDRFANSFSGLNEGYRYKNEAKPTKIKKIKFVKSLYVVFELK